MSVDVTAEEEAPDFADLDLTDPDHFSEGIPHHIFKRLRRHAPVLWTRAPNDWPESVGRGQWNVTRAEHMRTVSRDWQTFSAARGGIMMDNRQAGGLDLLRATLLGKDPPEHTRQRRIVDKALTPNRVARLEDGVRATVERYLRAFKTSGPADVVAGFTSKVPLNVVCDLLGVPEQDRAQVFAWSQAVIADHDPEMIRNYGRPGETRRQALEYVGGLLHERAKCPADDLATFFANATIDGEPVPHEHREGFFMQLFEAGADTTMNAMSFGIQAFRDRKSTRLNSSHLKLSRMPSSA